VTFLEPGWVAQQFKNESLCILDVHQTPQGHGYHDQYRSSLVASCAVGIQVD
jgi:hypothetical protein